MLVDVVNDYRGGSYGFFSSHASNTFSIAVFFAWLVRSRALTLVMVLWSLTNCWTRMYLGVHYPGDILCGALVGIVAATVVWFIYKKLTKQTFLPEVRDYWVPVAVGLLTVVGIALYSYYEMIY